MKLKDIIDEYQANGFISSDAGNGCSGPKWVAWDDDIAAEYGNIEMEKGVTAYDIMNARMVMNDSKFRPEYRSEWIEQENGYKFKIIF